MNDKVNQTAIRWIAAIFIVFQLCAAMVVGTYINARFGGPTSITITRDDDSDAPQQPQQPPGESEKNWLQKGGKGI